MLFLLRKFVSNLSHGYEMNRILAYQMSISSNPKESMCPKQNLRRRTSEHPILTVRKPVESVRINLYIFLEIKLLRKILI